MSGGVGRSVAKAGTAKAGTAKAGTAKAGATPPETAEPETASALDRYSAADWHDLWLSQVLANTVGHERPPFLPDLLADEVSAATWLAAAAERWCGEHEAPVPQLDLDLGGAGLRALRRLRDEVRGLIIADGGSIAAPIAVAVRGGRVSALPKGENVDWVRSAVAVEWLLARERGTLGRLKLCRNQRCVAAFYDRSKNNSRVWHDLSRCGNPANARAYRARRAAS